MCWSLCSGRERTDERMLSRLDVFGGGVYVRSGSLQRVSLEKLSL